MADDIVKELAASQAQNCEHLKHRRETAAREQDGQEKSICDPECRETTASGRAARGDTGRLHAVGHAIKYQNLQATIHMVLKRMVESGEVQEAIVPEDGKQVYRRPNLLTIGAHLVQNAPSRDGPLGPLKGKK